ncbi:ATP-binding cassette domain-containing protein [Ferrimonas balearica]|uniref:peptide ABC transporter ATP-binding protein n=1 Tax=Ferrimonas balearica TaxID=44012 RepID=UPI001C999C7B|nr:ATP-binding cassette domain-containing protein [Ferrimonas balearica]MBY5922148.1 ATP-binding cassette domain-containing protein [Ferrimonas balearica]MBY5994512.1 ATP-binding cassette domain-containing protein [Ferrimonas balearica]
MSALLEVRQLHKRFPVGGWWRRQYHTALSPLSFDLEAGQTLAFVGEAGSGRTTLARILTGAQTRTGGQILLDGKELESRNYRQRSRLIRMIFQDPSTSMNPRLRIGEQLEEPLIFNTDMDSEARRAAVEEILSRVGLLREHADFYPHMLAPGQRQRIAIARALMLEPKIIVADETFTGLDTSIRAQCINLLLQLQRELGLAYVLMSHDLGLVRHMADRVIVMKSGQVVEEGLTREVFDDPQHEYTKRLLEEQVFRLER